MTLLSQAHWTYQSLSRTSCRFALPIARIDFVLRKHLPVLRTTWRLSAFQSRRSAGDASSAAKWLQQGKEQMIG
jgi:hypothetical protein